MERIPTCLPTCLPVCLSQVRLLDTLKVPEKDGRHVLEHWAWGRGKGSHGWAYLDEGLGEMDGMDGRRGCRVYPVKVCV